MDKPGYVYILTNKNHTTLYVGVTSDLPSRIVKHREKVYQKGFSARYNVTKLVYFEKHRTIQEAIAREKQLKAGPRRNKEELIKRMNPEWKDLFEEVKYW
jgi:putative endonuclease